MIFNTITDTVSAVLRTVALFVIGHIADAVMKTGDIKAWALLAIAGFAIGFLLCTLWILCANCGKHRA